MTEQALRKMIAAGESTRQEFKSWVKCKDYRNTAARPKLLQAAFSRSLTRIAK